MQFVDLLICHMASFTVCFEVMKPLKVVITTLAKILKSAVYVETAFNK